MTAILLVIVGLAAAGGVGIGWDLHRKRGRVEVPAVYPACISHELDDRPLRQAWDSLTVEEQADLLREPMVKLREDLSLIAWLSEIGPVHLAVSDYGMSYG